MPRKFIIGVNCGHKIGPWNVPRSVQSAVFHYAALLNHEKISFIVAEYQQSTSVPNLMTYIKENKKNIKKIIFVSIFQLGTKKNEIYKTLRKLSPYECYFFIEGLNTRNSKLKFLKNYVNEAFKVKYYPSRKNNL
mgnify:CR=1 FL=1